MHRSAAWGGVPQYLSVAYGEPITLLPPFPVVIDTSRFPLTDDE
ncbi:hypothetical protein [Kineosporia succinea]|uniref:Uncharacterized protein n=1 Tax=Kineosporia succinea TaxID=84632 RepID=A0ABT9NV41_9ACTN|nr:hypothetical protein [Kineosporia succinea]MDP9824299.1 hypothetical protein [Kineosporia succinea]